MLIYIYPCTCFRGSLQILMWKPISSCPVRFRPMGIQKTISGYSIFKSFRSFSAQALHRCGTVDDSEQEKHFPSDRNSLNGKPLSEAVYWVSWCLWGKWCVPLQTDADVSFQIKPFPRGPSWKEKASAQRRTWSSAEYRDVPLSHSCCCIYQSRLTLENHLHSLIRTEKAITDILMHEKI